jgi:hypothetical protein
MAVHRRVVASARSPTHLRCARSRARLRLALCRPGGPILGSPSCGGRWFERELARWGAQHQGDDEEDEKHAHD